MASWAWEALGIARTEDIAAVRSAYATKLKALDLDSETQAYMDLREARDEALWQARNFDAGEYDFDPFAAGDEVASPPIDEPVEESETSFDEEEWEYEPVYHSNEHEQAIYDALIVDDQNAALTPAEQTAVAGDIDALLSDPQMDLIDHAGQTENWLAYVLSQSSPRSDPFIYAVADHFGWMRRKDEIALSYQIAFVTQRIALSQFIDQVQMKHHRFHGAWAELTKTGSSRRGIFIQKRDVQGLLAHVRDKFPDAEAMFDPELVRKWDHKISGPGKSTWSWGLAIFIGLQILLALGRCGNDTSVPVEPPATSRELANLTDIDRALEPIFGTELTAAMIKEEQPALSAALTKSWETAKARSDNVGTFEKALLELLTKRESAGIRKSSLSLITDRRQYELDILKQLTTSQCAAYIKTAQYPPGTLPGAMQKRRINLAARTLLETNVEPSANDRPSQFSVSAAVIDLMVKKSGMTFDKIKTAFAGKGTDAELCTARIALIEAALAQKGEDGLTLLREM
jgi:hypothetical protein